MLTLALLAAPIVAEAPATFDGMTSAQVEAALSDPARSTRAVEVVLRHPDAVNPFAYAQVVAALWSRGERLRAAFWFYLFQIRTRPWARGADDPSGYAALRASLNDSLGSTINGWLGTDFAAFTDVPARAIAWERRVPLHAARPEKVSAAQWRALVESERASYADGRQQMMASVDPAEWARQRRANGLPVGPLADPGPALPDAWR